MDYFKNDLASIHDDLVNKKYSVEELTKSTFDNIKKVDKEIEAFLKLDEERALEKARKIDERGVKADSILDGIGIGIKDNIVTKDLTTTAASKMLENFEPIYNATVMDKLNDFDLEKVNSYLKNLLAAMEQGLVSSSHDLSEGGLGVSLAEMVFVTDKGIKVSLRWLTLVIHYCARLGLS